jgi:hypothetical protein
MSKGVLDQAAFDASTRAAEQAAKRGMRAVMTSIGHNPDGSRTFYFRHERLKPKRGERISQPEPARERISQPVNVPRARISRGVAAGGDPNPPPAQGNLL